MAPVVLGIIGWILLLSSIIILILTLVTRFKLQKLVSFNTLSISDLLNSIITAILLVLYHIKNTDNNNSARSVNYEKLMNNSSNIFYDNVTGINEIINSTKWECVTETLIHYSMVLLPFTNTFVSNLLFFVQCHFCALHINSKCSMLCSTKLSMYSINRNIESNTTDNEIIDKISTEDKKNKIFKNCLPTFQFKKDTNMIANIGAICKWIVSFSVIGILCLADYNTMNMKQNIKNITCIYEANFPLSNCLSSFGTISIIALPSANGTINNNYTIYSEFQESYSNSTDVDKVVSSIFTIIHSILNETRDDHITSGVVINEPITTTDISKIKHETETTTISDNMIYAHIIKRIQGSNTNIKDKYKIGDTNKSTKMKNEILEQKTGRDSLSSEQEFKKYTEVDIDYYMENQCFISPMFLKLYFMALIFTLYFLPILFSSILLIRCKSTCGNIMEKLKMIQSISYDITNSGKPNSNINSASSSWNSDNNTMEEEKYNKKYATNIMNNENTKSLDKALIKNDQEKYVYTLYTKTIQKIFENTKISLLFSTFLWTILLIEILLKIFACMPIPDWLMNSSYTIAIMFIIIRDVLNYYNFKSENYDNIATFKKNIVHPTSIN